MSISTCAEGFAEGDFNFKMFLVAKKVLKSERGGTVHPITPSQGLEGVNVNCWMQNLFRQMVLDFFFEKKKKNKQTKIHL